MRSWRGDIGVGVRGITLELLGGFTEMDRDAPSPRSEAAIALAGPGVSLVLAVVGGLALPITERGTVLGDLAFQFAASNAIVAVFNGLPGLPLDGGRALRAGSGRRPADPYKADVAAGWSGRVIALATLGLSILLFYPWRVSHVRQRAASRPGRDDHVERRVLGDPVGPDQGPATGAAVPGGWLGRCYTVASGTPLSEALRQRDEAPGGLTEPHRAMLGIADGLGRVVGLVDNARGRTRTGRAAALGRRRQRRPHGRTGRPYRSRRLGLPPCWPRSRPTRAKTSW